MPDAPLLLHAATARSADLLHAIPSVIVDPFTYVEDRDRRVAAIGVLDADRVRAAGVDVIDPSALGRDQLVAAGTAPRAIEAELALRTCRELGVAEARVPPEFPLHVADHLRDAGIGLTVDVDAFAARRRRKTPEQVAGIRRAQRAAERAMAVAAELIRSLPDGLTAEAVRSAMRAACDEAGCELPSDVIVAHGPQAVGGHDPGSGPLLRGEPVIVDIWPCDAASRCWADMTRTYVAGGGAPPPELLTYWRICRESLANVIAATRAGLAARELFATSCAPFTAAGIATQLTKTPGVPLTEGFLHSLGHGVGLEVHEPPALNAGPDVLVAGDVIAVEPGCYRHGFGGCRLEDLLLVTEDGCENLTDFPYEL